MKIQCPSCSDISNVDDNKIPDNGVYVNCKKCETEFLIKKSFDKCPICSHDRTENDVGCPNCKFGQRIILKKNKVISDNFWSDAIKEIKSKLVGLFFVFCVVSVYFFWFGDYSNIRLVKNGTLTIDSDVTVGDAFEGYKYFKTRKWKFFKDSQKRQVVEFNGVYDYDKFIGTTVCTGLEFTPNMTRATTVQLTANMVNKTRKSLEDIKSTYVIQFTISKDNKSFQARYSGIEITRITSKIPNLSEDIQKVPVKTIKDVNLSTLKKIYSNEPEEEIGALILTTGE